MTSIRRCLLAGWLAIAAGLVCARGAVTIDNVRVTNVGTTTFTVVWTTSELSTPGLDVFSDSEGAHQVTGFGIEYYPLTEGDPALASDADARAARRALESLARLRLVTVVRVSGLAPGTLYYVRPRTFGAGGVDNGAAVVPLQAITTASYSSFVPDARLLRVRFPGISAEGMVALVFGPEGTLPLSAIVGDDTEGDTALVSLANLFSVSTGTNALYAVPQTIKIRLLGEGAPAGLFTEEVAFTGAFAAAAPEIVEVSASSPAPFFTQHPLGTSQAIGGSAVFTVVATGTPAPTYLWQRKAAGSDTWMDLIEASPYSGVATASLTVAPLTLAMSGDQFRAQASNGVLPNAISDAATLTVNAAPTAPAIVEPPVAAAVVVGQNAAFSVTASGTAVLTYQWQRKPAGSDEWSNLTEELPYLGTATVSLAVGPATLVMNGDAFRVVVSNGILPDAISAAAVLTVSAAPTAPVITTDPQSQSVSPAANATFTVAATGVPSPSIRWQRKLAGGEAWTDLENDVVYSGVTTETLTVAAVTPAMSGDAFRAIASNGTPPDATSLAATLTVLSPPTISGHPQSASVTSGTNASFSVTASGTGTLEYRWERLASGQESWTPLSEGASYTGVATPALTVVHALMVMHGDQFRCVVSNANGSTPSDAATLSVLRTAGLVTLSNLRQAYDGTPKEVGVATVPAGLAVTVTYGGSATPPTVPGTYAVTGEINDPDYTGSVNGQLVIATGIVVRKAPSIAGDVVGSVQVINAESFTVSGSVSGDVLVPGKPTVVSNAGSNYGGTLEGPGATQPTTHTVTIAATAVVRHVVTQVDPVTLPTLTAPPATTGTRTVTLSQPSQTAGDFSTLRNLTIGGTAGTVAVPPGTYGSFIVNGNGVLQLGVAGESTPVVYNVQSISINQLRNSASLAVVGPVILNVGGSATFFGPTGSVEHPEWLTINVVGGAVNVNHTAAVHGHIVAPARSVSISGTSVLHGSVVADQLTVAATAAIEEVAP